MRIFPHSMRMAESARGRRDEDCPEINSENDARVREQTARACDHYIRHRRIENVLYFRVRRHEAFQKNKHSMQPTGVGAEQAQQMPEKQCAWSKREKEQIRHLCGQPGRIVHRGFPNQPARNAPNQSEIFHLRRSLLCRVQISIKVQMLSRVLTLCVCLRSYSMSSDD